jgi:sugar phosphate isomerase/epimerase
MQSAITISLVPQARGGPFVFWDDLAAGFEKAAALGFDAVEIFAPDAKALDADVIRPLMDRHKLKVAAVGTGAGWVIQKLTLTNPDASVCRQAREFIRAIIDSGQRLGAPAIIGSMQGRWGEGVSRDQAIANLTDALDDLGEYARGRHVPLIYEPLNRYETNLANTQADGVALLKTLRTKNVTLLADLFHMNIEETDLPAAIRSCETAITHMHLADSNRRPAGYGHTDFAPIAQALREIEFTGYVSAECLSWPDADTAAAKTIETYRRYFAVEQEED